eukprot:30465-Pelagococcus_subviridis.AAC.2
MLMPMQMPPPSSSSTSCTSRANPEPVLQRDRDVHGLAHPSKALPHELRVAHQDRAEALLRVALARHLGGRAPRVEIHLVVSIRRVANLRRAREPSRGAPAELDRERVLRRVVPEHLRSRGVRVDDGVLVDHLRPEVRPARERPADGAEVRVRAVEHRRDGEAVRVARGGEDDAREGGRRRRGGGVLRGGHLRRRGQ